MLAACVVAGGVLVVGELVLLGSSGGLSAADGALDSGGAVAVVSSGSVSLAQLAVSLVTYGADSLVLAGSGAALVSSQLAVLSAASGVIASRMPFVMRV